MLQKMRCTLKSLGPLIGNWCANYKHCFFSNISDPELTNSNFMTLFRIFQFVRTLWNYKIRIHNAEFAPLELPAIVIADPHDGISQTTWAIQISWLGIHVPRSGSGTTCIYLNMYTLTIHHSQIDHDSMASQPYSIHIGLGGWVGGCGGPTEKLHVHICITLNY